MMDPGIPPFLTAFCAWNACGTAHAACCCCINKWVARCVKPVSEPEHLLRFCAAHVIDTCNMNSSLIPGRYRDMMMQQCGG